MHTPRQEPRENRVRGQEHQTPILELGSDTEQEQKLENLNKEMEQELEGLNEEPVQTGEQPSQVLG